MAEPKEKLWPIEPHTIAKHVILRNYLRAWFPIMGRYNKRLLFFDGYAGPGEYNNGEPGSPIIALLEALNYFEWCEMHGFEKPEIVFFFIEENKERYEHLESRIKAVAWPKEFKISVINSNFEEIATALMVHLESKKLKLAPAFVFIDPFGYRMPFEIVKKFMGHEKCEVFINFMYEFINRFILREGQERVMTSLFGTEVWADLQLENKSATQRKDAIHGLYQAQLEEHAASFVRSFEMKGTKNSTKYFMFYGTNHKLGLEKMKDAMWKVDAGGNYIFSDYTDPNQLVLFGEEPNYEQLKHLLKANFFGKLVTIEQVEEFVVCQTPFRKAHLKTNTLVPMEKNGEIRVHTERSKKWTYPGGTVIEFL